MKGFLVCQPYFIVDGLILLLVTLVELLGLAYAFFSVYESFVVYA
jgi:hypothetical protein